MLPRKDAPPILTGGPPVITLVLVKPHWSYMDITIRQDWSHSDLCFVRERTYMMCNKMSDVSISSKLLLTRKIKVAIVTLLIFVSYKSRGLKFYAPAK